MTNRSGVKPSAGRRRKSGRESNWRETYAPPTPSMYWLPHGGSHLRILGWLPRSAECCWRKASRMRHWLSSATRWRPIRTMRVTLIIAASPSGCSARRLRPARISNMPCNWTRNWPRPATTSARLLGRGNLHVRCDVLPVRQLVRLELGRERRRNFLGTLRSHIGFERERSHGILFRLLGAAPDGHITGQAGQVCVGVIGDHKLDHDLLF